MQRFTIHMRHILTYLHRTVDATHRLRRDILKYIERAIMRFYQLIDTTSHTEPQESSLLLAQYARELKGRITELGNKSPDTNTSWQENLRNLRLSITRDDPRDFISWPVIQGTMFHHSSKCELDYLKKDASWRNYQTPLIESTVGNPPPYPYLPSSSGNLIHNLYHIAQLRSVFPLEIKDLKTVFEFGGGYGSNCRLVYALGFQGTFIIFDLPEFNAIQKYFLSCIGVYKPEKTILASTTTEIEQAIDRVGSIELFIATWSLSESPVNVREKIWVAIGEPSYILIAYQERFEEVDNKKYFANFKKERSNYEWVEYEVPHIQGSYYLFGKKKS